MQVNYANCPKLVKINSSIYVHICVSMCVYINTTQGTADPSTSGKKFVSKSSVDSHFDSQVLILEQKNIHFDNFVMTVSKMILLKDDFN